MSVIAIDGPAGAGKSSVARAVASALGATYVDTGAMYRAIALAALEAGVDPADANGVAAVLERVRLEASGEMIRLDGVDVTDRIRTPSVTHAAALVAKHRAVRTKLVDIQRGLARSADVVMEGRDIGTAVFPDADVKVYLTASLDERVRRRMEQLGLPRDQATRADVKADIERRDSTDATRSESPLKKAPDAVVLDTTDMSAGEVVARICEIAESIVDGGARR